MAAQSTVDGGWGWLITFAVFCTNILCVGFFRAFGVFFVEISDTFQTASSLTALIMGVQAAVCCLTVLMVHNVLLDRLDIRTCGRLGGMVMAAGMMLGALANGVPVLILTLGALVGIGNGFTYGPGIVLLGQYFNKRRALANSLASMGSSVGSMTLPVLATFLLTRYGLRGALLVYGAVTFHICVFTSLYRPFVGPDLTWLQQKDKETCEVLLYSQTKHSCKNVSTNAQSCESTVSTNLHKDDGDETAFANNMDNSYISITNVLTNAERPESSTSLNKTEVLNHCNNTYFNKPILIQRQNGPEVFSSDSGLFKGKSNLYDARKHSLSVAELPVGTAQLKHQGVFGSLSKLCLENALQHLSQPQLVVEGAICREDHEDMGVTSSHSDNSEFDGDTADRDDASKKTSHGNLKRCVSCDSSLFRMPTFWLVQAYVCAGIMGATGGGSFTPALMQEKGLDKNDVAVALAVWGACNLLGRFVSGLLADRNVLRPGTISSVAFLGIGFLFISVSFLPLTLWAWILFSVVFGLFEGVYFSMLPEVIISLVSQPRFQRTFGFVQLSQSMFSSMMYPLLGGLKDISRSYNAAFYLLGACALTAAALLQVMPTIRTVKSFQYRNNQVSFNG